MISVISFVYNEEKHLAECIESVISQSYRDIEFVIVDDGSSDSTLKICREYAKRDSRIHVVEAGHQGKVHSVNLGVQASSGDWLAFTAGDDVMEPGILQRWIAETEGFDAKNEQIAIISRIRMFSDEPQYAKYNGVEIPKKKDRVCTSGVAELMSRAAAKHCFPIPETLPNEDGWKALFFRYTDIKLIPCPCVCLNYRIHSGNSVKKDAPFERFREQFFSREKVCPLFIDRYASELSEEAVAQISRRYRLAELTYQGDFLKIATMPKILFKDRIRALFTSNKLLYALKIRLNVLFYGH